MARSGQALVYGMVTLLLAGVVLALLAGDAFGSMDLSSLFAGKRV
jgi:hypothetical protein